MKIVFADTQNIDRRDIDWSPLKKRGEVITFSDTSAEEAEERFAGAEAVFVDSFSLNREIMEKASGLRFIGAAATGYNNIDTEAAADRGIAVCNVPAYSTEAVAQHAIALLLTLAGHIREYDEEVHTGLWNTVNGMAFHPWPVTLLAGKSLGIIGMGDIGSRVAEIAKALGMRVIRYREDPEGARQADAVSLHCPLTKETAGMIDEEFLSGMKDGAILINTARGGLIDEEALARALREGKLSGAGLDVTAQEPPDPDCPLLSAPRCIITPHIAFAPVEIRQRVIDICAENLEAFLSGEEKNRIV